MESETNPVAAVANDLKPLEIISMVKDYSKQLEDNIVSAVNLLKSFDRDLATKVRHVNEIQEDMKEAVQAAYIYINNIENLFFYGQCTLFEEIKNEIRKGNSEKLEQFLSKMDKSLQYIGQAHQSYAEKCNKVYKTCTSVSESCDLQLAEIKNNKQKSLKIAGVAGVVGVAGVTAAVLFPVFGTVYAVAAGSYATMQLGKALLAIDDVQKLQGQEEAYKKMGLIFKKLSSHGIELKKLFNELHVIVENYETNHRIIITIDRKDQEGLCTALDRLKSLLQSPHSETLKARDTLKTLKNKIR